MADGSITFATDLDNEKLEKKLSSIGGKIKKLEEELNQKKDTQSGIEKELDDAKKAALETETTIKNLKAEMASLRSATGVEGSLNPAQYAAALERQKSITAELKEQEAALAKQDKETERISNQYAKCTDQVMALSEKIDVQKETYGEIARQIEEINSKSNKMGLAIDTAGKHMDKFTERVKNLARRVLVFSVITMALRQMRTWMSKVIKTNDEATSAMARLKGALLTLAQPLVNVVIPAFTVFVDVLTKIVSTAANVVSSLFGTTVEESAQAAENLYDEQNAIEGIGDAAKKAGKSMASFDEINKLSDDSKKDSSNSAITRDFSGVIGQRLSEIEALVGGSLLAVGAILTFSGANIPLGIGLMALGAITFGAVAKENWDAIYQALTGKLAPLYAYLSGSLLVLGAIIAFSGANLGLGIGLMVAGAVGMATIVSLNWGAIHSFLQGPVGAVTAIASGALLALGALIAFSGANIPLGIGLMVAGALGMAASISANWSALLSVLQGPVGVITAFLSTALLVIGALILFSGANIPLGLGLLVTGAVGLAAVVTINWETVQQILEGPIGAVTGILSASLLVLGAVLLFSGASIPIGLGLMVVGAAGLATSVAANWDAVQTALQGPIGVVTALLSSALLALGAILTFSGANLPLGIGLIVVGAIGLVETAIVNWESITETLGGPIAAVTAIASAALLALGVILLFSGAGIPLGLGLIVAGAAGLAASIVPNWDAILDKLKEVFGSVADWWNNEVVPFWKEAGSSIINGILDGLKGAWSAITSWVTNAVNWIKEAFGGAAKSASNLTKTINNDNGGAVRTKAVYAVSNLTIPHLARGAVIPPNREFMAVLGDQKSGTNIEAPVSEIEAAVARGVVKAGLQTNGPVQIELIVSTKAGMAREMKFELDRESKRQGVKLVQGV